MLKKLAFKPGINREGTSYTAEGTWYACDKVRFRSGQPEKIGGWQAVSQNTFIGVCRSLFNWGTLGGLNLVGLGTSKKYYVENGGTYYDVTPQRATSTLGTNPLATTNGSPTVTVTHANHGAKTGDYIALSGATGFNGLTAGNLTGTFEVTVLTSSTYTITVAANATSAGSGGGSAVIVKYDISAGSDIGQTLTGWGAGGWGVSTWSSDPTVVSVQAFRVWSQYNYGENLLLGPAGGPLYYLDMASGLTSLASRAVALSSLPNAADVPSYQTAVIVSDSSRFVIVFGTNEIGSSTKDPMLIRWSDQENLVNWTPSITNQAGGIRLSNGTKIVAAKQSKQEILIWTDAALYSMQFVGPPYVWGTQLMGENISIASSRAAVTTNNAAFWMGTDKFYVYNGRVDTLACAVKNYVFADLNEGQRDQIFAGTNEGFNEIWWFYCSAGSSTIDRYVIYNYAENLWYYGTLARTAWIDSGLRPYPMAADYNGRLLAHETGSDDASLPAPQPINAYVQSGDFDIEDGQTFGFVTRIIPDLTFNGSASAQPSVTMVLYPRNFSGAPYGSEPPQAVVRGQTYAVEQYTQQVFVRLRGRQMALKIESSTLGTAWQLGHPRMDIRSDGRKA